MVQLSLVHTVVVPIGCLCTNQQTKPVWAMPAYSVVRSAVCCFLSSQSTVRPQLSVHLDSNYLHRPQPPIMHIYSHSPQGQFCCCSQVSNGNCDQGSKPATRLACNQVPCAVSDPGLTLGFTAWGECGVQCGSGYSQRTAYCMNPYGALADLSMCSNYSGELNSASCSLSIELGR